MENGESTHEGAHRETIEEAGARIEMGDPFSILDVPQVEQVHLFFLAGQLSVVGLAIMLKYRSYVPNERLAGNEPLVTTAAVFSVLPGLFLLPLIMLLHERRMALQNLETYFHGDPH